MKPVFLFLLLNFQLAGYCQNNGVSQKSVDSLSRSIDSSQKQFKAWQDSFSKVQDSIYQAAQIGRDSAQMNRNMTSFLEMQKERERKENQQAYIRFGIAFLVLLLLVVRFFVRRKRK